MFKFFWSFPQKLRQLPKISELLISYIKLIALFFSYKVISIPLGYTGPKPASHMFQCLLFLRHTDEGLCQGSGNSGLRPPPSGVKLRYWPYIKVCHSEEANQTFIIWVQNHRPTKNISFQTARSVFLPIQIKPDFSSRLEQEILRSPWLLKQFLVIKRHHLRENNRSCFKTRIAVFP
jgi:hypothetical protein